MYSVLVVLNNVHSGFASISPLLFVDLCRQVLHRVAFEIPLGVLASLDNNVGLLLHSARQQDDLFES